MKTKFNGYNKNSTTSRSQSDILEKAILNKRKDHIKNVSL
jgi:hypothetical protein